MRYYYIVFIIHFFYIQLYSVLVSFLCFCHLTSCVFVILTSHLNQTVEHILSHYILLRGLPNLTQTDWAISVIWLGYS